MKKYIYLDYENNAPIMVFAKRKPSEKTLPRSGTWVLKEWTYGQWAMPCFPEVTWNILKRMTFVGKFND